MSAFPMNIRLPSAVLLALLSIASPSAFAKSPFSYTCRWVSEVTPDAVIQFTSTNGTGTYQGSLLYKGQPVFEFREGQFQGYGSNWWSTGAGDETSGRVVVFMDHRVVRGTPVSEAHTLRKGETRLLIVGLGSAIWYGNALRWRGEESLLTAGEGFWRPSAGCRKMF